MHTKRTDYNLTSQALTRRRFLKSVGILPILIRSSRGDSPSGAFPEQRYRDAIVIDGLCEIEDPEKVDDKTALSPRAAAELRESGVTAFHTTVGAVGNNPESYQKTLETIAKMEAFIAANNSLLTKARGAADISQAKAERKIAIVYGFQDTYCIGPQLERLEFFKDLGVRVVQLTYNKRNLSGDGALEPANGGISDLGRKTVEKIEALNLLLDLSHGGQRLVAEAIAHAKRPMLISHTGCRALHDHPRNVADPELKAMAEKGGVMGVYFMSFLVPGYKATSADVIRHLEHAINVCGEDHVAIGTDGKSRALVIDEKMRQEQRKFFEERKAKGLAAPGEASDNFDIVAGYNTHLRFRTLADDLAKAGWPGTRVEKILGRNLMRIFQEVWGS